MEAKKLLDMFKRIHFPESLVYPDTTDFMPINSQLDLIDFVIRQESLRMKYPDNYVVVICTVDSQSLSKLRLYRAYGKWYRFDDSKLGFGDNEFTGHVYSWEELITTEI